MADVLVYTSDIDLSHQVADTTNTLGLRTRIATDVATAVDWFLVRSFNVIVVDSGVDITVQEKLADRLWKNNLESLLIVLDTKDRNRPSELRLFGAEVISGSNLLDKLKKYLERYIIGNQKDIKEFNVLVVDDLESPRDIICIFLEELGLSVKTKGVGSAIEAMEILSNNKQPFSCVITDIRMPKVSGADLIRFIRSKPHIAHLPIIALTAFGTMDCLLDCLKSGASGFLVKPPKKQDMLREIQRAKRIIKQRLNPRLVRDGEENLTEDFLVSRGIYL